MYCINGEVKTEVLYSTHFPTQAPSRPQVTDQHFSTLQPYSIVRNVFYLTPNQYFCKVQYTLLKFSSRVDFRMASQVNLFFNINVLLLCTNVKCKIYAFYEWKFNAASYVLENTT